MDQNLEKLLIQWPLPFLRDLDIAIAVSGSPGKRYAAVNRALKKKILIRLKRGVYLIGPPFRKQLPSNAAIAHVLYGPSYISFESALSYHQWIPEAVNVTLCATAKRAQKIDAATGLFSYLRVPTHLFYLGVKRLEDDHNTFFIADPWKAIADHFYVYKRKWKSLADLYSDLRIEKDLMLESDLDILRFLSQHYQSNRVRKFLVKILKELESGN